MDLVRAQSTLTVHEAMSQEHQISFLKAQSPEVAEKVILLMVELVAEQLNVKENFSGIQLVDCTLSILEVYWYLRPEEILFAFKQGKLGKYGPVYNKLDTQTLLEWLHKYDTQERIREIEARRDEYKKAESEPQVDIHAAYMQERVAQYQNDGVPTLVIQDREKRKKEKEKRRNELSFQQYQEQYFKSKQSSETPPQ